MPKVRRSVPYTNRTKRPDEVPGERYRFVTTNEFARMRETRQFIASEECLGIGFGLTRREAELAAADRQVLLVRGGKDMVIQLREIPGVVSVLLTSTTAGLVVKLEALHGEHVIVVRRLDEAVGVVEGLLS